MSAQKKWLGWILAICLALGVYAFPVSASGKVERVAKLTEVKNDVRVKKAGGAKPFKAFNNMTVTRGDSIYTGANSSVQLQLDDGSKIVIGANTQSLISELVTTAKGGKVTAIKVVNGQVWSKIKSVTNANDRFQFETPTAVMGIRGTMLFITAAPKQSGLWVTEGAVGVRSIQTTRSQESIVRTNHRIETQPDRITGEKIDAAALVESMDITLLREASEDIMESVQEIAAGGSGGGNGKGMSNEFLLQAEEFIQEASSRDSTIDVPEDWETTLHQVEVIVEEWIEENPNPPGIDETTEESEEDTLESDFTIEEGDDIEDEGSGDEGAEEGGSDDGGSDDGGSDDGSSDDGGSDDGGSDDGGSDDGGSDDGSNISAAM